MLDKTEATAVQFEKEWIKLKQGLCTVIGSEKDRFVLARAFDNLDVEYLKLIYVQIRLLLLIASYECPFTISSLTPTVNLSN